jgi:hypothetical protein
LHLRTEATGTGTAAKARAVTPDIVLSNFSHRDILEKKRAYEENAAQHDQFFRQLTAAGNEGFNVISEYFGRSVFSKGAAAVAVLTRLL